MHSIRYRFYPNDEFDDVEDYFDQYLSPFLADLTRNGQIVDADANIAQVDDFVEIYCITPELDSLEMSRLNKYARIGYEKLCEVSRIPPEYELIGRAFGVGATCNCKSPSWYFLYTDLFETAPPVRCGDCGRHVPLYRLPKINVGDDYHSILSWAATFRNCDHLYTGSGVGERFGFRQIHSPKSELSQEGLAICRRLSEAAGKPVYYFLVESISRTTKMCPSCGGDWMLEDQPFTWVGKKCDKCRLVSS